MAKQPTRFESRYGISLDWIDCAAILICGYAGIAVMSLAGADLTKHGKWTLGALFAGPLARRAIIGAPRPHKPESTKLGRGAALVFLATALVVGGGALMLLTFRWIDGKPIESGIYVAFAVTAGAFAIGALLDRRTRVANVR